MAKFLKVTGTVLGIIAVLIIVAIILLMTFVSPNRFKPVIVEQAKKFTGRELIIDGDLSWTFFPSLGVKAGHMSLGNPPGFNQKVCAEISSATIEVKVLPLLHGRIQSEGIVLHGMNLNLIKNANGQTNWVFAANTTKTQDVAASAPQQNTMPIRQWAISSVDITDTHISWIDEQAKKTADINNFEFHAKDINLTKPVPIKSQFDFSTTNPDSKGHADLTSDIAFNLDKQVYTLRDLIFSAQVNQANKKVNIKITGDVTANLEQQTLQWENFKANVNNLQLVGKLNVSQLKTEPTTSGNMTVMLDDPKTFLQNLKVDTANLQVIKPISGDMNFAASAKGVNAALVVKTDAVETSTVKLSNIKANLHYQNGMLDLTPLTANVYQGDLNAQGKVNLTTAVPQITLNAKLNNIHAEAITPKVSGIANVDAQVTTAGKESKGLIKNLNGTVHVTANNGVLQGIDLGYIVDNAYALFSHQTSSQTNSNQTSFGNLTATGLIHDGVVTNNDLSMVSPRFNTTGKGTIDLNTQNMDYTLQAVVNSGQNSKIKGLSGVVIPIRVTGNLSSPTVRLDTSSFMKAAAQQQMQQHKQEIQQQIEDKISGQAGKLLQNLLGH